jgi:hypothetical protein
MQFIFVCESFHASSGNQAFSQVASTIIQSQFTSFSQNGRVHTIVLEVLEEPELALDQSDALKHCMCVGVECLIS